MEKKIDIINSYLDELFPNPKCELNYNKDYELLIAIVLSAQSTDARVNKVTKVLFDKYDLNGLKEAKLSDLEDIIRSVGTYTIKSKYIKEREKTLFYRSSVLFIFAELIDIDIREFCAEPCFAFFLIHFKTDYLIDLSFRSYLKQDLTLLGIRDLIVAASFNKIFHLIFVARSKIGNERLRQVIKLSLHLCFF